MSKKISGFVVAIFLGTTIAVLFQNCSPANFKDDPSVAGVFSKKDLDLFTREDVAIDGSIPDYFVNPKVPVRSLTLLTLPTLGTIFNEDGDAVKVGDTISINFRYVPSPNKNGTDSFQVRELDNHKDRGEVVRTVAIVIEPVVDGFKIPRQTIRLTNTPATFSWGTTASSILPPSVLNDPEINGDGIKITNLEIKAGSYKDGARNCTPALCSDGTGGKTTELGYNSSTKNFSFDTNNKLDLDLVFLITAIDEVGGRWDFELEVTFSNPIKDIQPSLAMANSSCILCHARVRGTLITDFNASGGKADIGFSSNLMTFVEGIHHNFAEPTARDASTADLLGGVLPGKGDQVRGFDDFLMSSFNSSLFYGSKIIVPKLQLNDYDAIAANSYINLFKNDVKFDFRTLPAEPNAVYMKWNDGPESKLKAVFNKVWEFLGTARTWTVAAKFDANLAAVASVGEYLDAMTSGRKPSAFTMSAERKTEINWPAAVTDADINASIREVGAVKISAPSAADIVAIKNSDAKNYSYYVAVGLAWNLQAGLPAGLVEDPLYFKNNGPITCEGQLVLVGKPLVLTNAEIKTNRGCTIYSEHTVFVQNTNDTQTTVRKGIVITPPATTPSGLHHLQVTSAAGIALGLGQCANGEVAPGITNTFKHRERYMKQYFVGMTTIPMMDDFNTVTENGAALTVLKDAAVTCRDGSDIANAKRKVGFERVFLNAPQIQSRYSGDFSGVAIARWSIFALGNFSYRFDPVFDSIEIDYFQRMPGFFSSYFSVPKCASPIEKFAAEPGRHQICR